MIHTLIRKLPFAVLLCVGLGSAQAQTGYTAKELKKPFGAYMCNSSHVLSDNGDAALICLYSSGFDWSTFQQRYDTYKVTVFRKSGAVQTLPTASGTSIRHIVGIDRNGRVLAATRKNGSSTLDYAWWQGTTRTAFTPPAGFAGAWQLADLSPSGKVLGYRSAADGGQGSIAVFDGSAGQAVPLAPVSIGTMSFSAGAVGVINDNGQFAITQFGTNGTTDPSPWFWDGAQWRLIHNPETDRSGRRLVGINTRGDVLMVDTLVTPQAHLWQAASGTSTVLTALNLRQNVQSMALGSNGDVLGTIAGDSTFSAAAIWRNGVAQNLNKLVTMPSGIVLTSARDINASGQILALSGENTTTRVWLLTPR